MARGSLVDVVDHLLDRGVVLQGDSMVTLAGVDLFYLRLNVLLASAETLRRTGGTGADSVALGGPMAPAPMHATEAAERPIAPPRPIVPPTGGADVPPGIAVAVAEPDLAAAGEPSSQAPQAATDRARASRSLAQLIVTLAEFLRQIVERQAIKRAEGGGLDDEQVERIGLALAELERSMREMRDLFEIEERDLELDLGPLGKIV